MNIAEVIARKLPGAQFSIGPDYESLEMHDDTPKPSQAQIDAWWIEVEVTLKKEELLVDLNENTVSASNIIKNGYTQSEIDSWFIQEPAANEWIEGTPNTYIDQYAATSGLSQADIVARIQTKAAAYRILQANIQGQVTPKRDAIKNATTMTQLNEIDVTIVAPSV